MKWSNTGRLGTGRREKIDFVRFPDRNASLKAVVRRFLPFKVRGRTPSGPAHLEFRLLFGRGRLLAAESYDDFDVDVPDFSAFERLARKIEARFFTLDVAMLEDGRWVVVEVNDGGVSGLPASIDPRELFAALLGPGRRCSL